MPADKTITAFYTFAPREKIRSSRENNNFSVFRGHLLPVDPTTAAAVCDCYCLGTTDYRWAEGHFNELYVAGSAIAASWETGDIKSSLVASAASGWLLCDGSTINKTTNPTYTALVDFLRALDASFQGSIAAEAFLPNVQSKFLIGAGTGDSLSTYTLGSCNGEECQSFNHLHYFSKVCHTLATFDSKEYLYAYGYDTAGSTVDFCYRTFSGSVTCQVTRTRRIVEANATCYCSASYTDTPAYINSAGATITTYFPTSAPNTCLFKINPPNFAVNFFIKY